MHKRLIIAAILAIIGFITTIVTPRILASFDETKSVGQRILELSEDIVEYGENKNHDVLRFIDDNHSDKYKNYSLGLDILAYGSTAAGFLLAFLSMLKLEHKYAHYIVWVVCLLTIAVKLTFMIAGIALVVFIVLAALALSGGN
jgi:hypothetical protein